MNDDFDPIEDIMDNDNDLNDGPQLSDIFDNSDKGKERKSLRERIDSAKETKGKWENRIDKFKQRKDNLLKKPDGNNIAKNASQNLGKNATQNAAQNAGKNAINGVGKNAGKKAMTGLGKNTAGAAGKKAAGAAAKSGAKAAGKTAAKTGAKVATEAGKTAAKTAAKTGAKAATTAAKTGAKAAISTGAAAGTAGVSIAVEAGLKAVQIGRKIQGKVLKGIGKIAGINLEKHEKTINRIITILTPVLCCVCCFMCCFMGNSVLEMHGSVIDSLNEAIEKGLEEVNEDKTEAEKITLATANADDMEVIKKKIIEIFSDKTRGLQDVIDGIVVAGKEAEKQKEEENKQKAEELKENIKNELLGEPRAQNTTENVEENAYVEVAAANPGGMPGIGVTKPQNKPLPPTSAAAGQDPALDPQRQEEAEQQQNHAAANPKQPMAISKARSFADLVVPYFYAEKFNFNNIKWKDVNIETEEEKDSEMEFIDEYLMKVPKKLIPEQPDIDVKALANEMHPYLMQWIIPTSTFVTTLDKTIADTYLEEEMSHEIQINRYAINQYQYNEVTVYKAKTKKVPMVDNDGNQHVLTEPVRDESGNPVIEKKVSVKKGPESKKFKEVKNIIVTANTYWGTMKFTPKIKLRDESTKKSSSPVRTDVDEEGYFTETVTYTYEDTIDTSEKEIKMYKIWQDGKEVEVKEPEPEKNEEGEESDEEAEKDKYPSIVRPVNVSNSPTFKEKYKLSITANTLDAANSYIKKYHEDAYIKEQEGSFVNSVTERDGMSFGWPIKDEKATMMVQWYKENIVTTFEGLTIIGEPKNDDDKFEVVAAAAGKIAVIRKNLSGSKGYIEITHTNGYRTMYAGLINIPEELKENSEVAAGDVIGEMGIGKNKDAFIKFTIEKNGVAVNPFEYFLYTTESNEKYNKIVRVFNGLKVDTALGNGTIGATVMSEDWNKRIAAMIDEAIIMEELRGTIYSQANRQLFVDYRQTSADCSSWCATMYYRFFDKAKIGTYTGDQYPMSAVSGINAMKVENYVDGEGFLDTSKLMPGDLLFRNPMGNASGYPHVIMYVGGYKDLPEDAYIHHGSGWGPKFGYFNKLTAQGRREYSNFYAIRYYRDGDIISTGGGGAANLGDIDRGSMANSKLVSDVISKYGASIKNWSAKFGLDPGIVLGMICQESGGNPNSYNGYALGLMQIEHVHWGKTVTMQFKDGTSQRVTIDQNKLRNPDYNIMIGCWEFSTQMQATGGNPLIAIQGYNYGYGGIRRCVGYYLSKGANTNKMFCGMSEAQFQEYCRSGDTGWLGARAWYTSTGHRIFGGGGGTKDHLERVLRYYKQF